MFSKKIVLAVAALSVLSACNAVDLNNPFVRTGAGALAGAGVASATGNSPVLGAALGAGAGAVSCGVKGLPPCEKR